MQCTLKTFVRGEWCSVGITLTSEAVSHLFRLVSNKVQAKIQELHGICVTRLPAVLSP